MRSAIEWAKMYSEHVGSLNEEELEAFVAAVQLNTLEGVGAKLSKEAELISKKAGRYPENLF